MLDLVLAMGRCQGSDGGGGVFGFVFGGGVHVVIGEDIRWRLVIRSSVESE